MGEFSYLPYVIIDIILEYILLVCIAYAIVIKDTKENFYWMEIPKKFAFKIASQSLFGDGKLHQYFLAGSRFISMIYFVVYLIVTLVTSSDHGMFIFYFTNWNILLLISFFFIAFISSLLRITQSNVSETQLEYLGIVVILIYCVVTPSAYFVTFVDLVFLSAKPSYGNYSAHLVTSVLVSVELFQNNIPVSWKCLMVCISWPMLYLIFIWPIIAESVRNHWPYDFLSTSSASCFFWYNILFVLVIFFYSIFWLLSHIKYRYYVKLHPSESLEGDVETPSPAFR
jgi:hypothetical protein